MKLILTNNINTVLQEFEEALKEGYRFTNASNLVTSMTGMHELFLYKEEIDVTVMTYEDATETLTISGYDKNDVLKCIQVYILNGYSISNVNEWLETSLKSVTVHNPDHPNCRVYTKEELTEMSYEDLKQIGKLRNCFNRSRAVMQEQILRYQEPDK